MQQGSFLDFLWGGGIACQGRGQASNAPFKNPPTPEIQTFPNLFCRIKIENENYQIHNSNSNINNRNLGLIRYEETLKPKNYNLAIRSALQDFKKVYDENTGSLYAKDDLGQIKETKNQSIRFCV